MSATKRETRESFQERLAEAGYRQLLNRLMAIEQKLGLIPQDGFDRANGTSEPVIKRVIGPATEDELTCEAFRAGAAWERRRRALGIVVQFPRRTP